MLPSISTATILRRHYTRIVVPHPVRLLFSLDQSRSVGPTRCKHFRDSGRQGCTPHLRVGFAWSGQTQVDSAEGLLCH
jgi:hypothetical protein